MQRTHLSDFAAKHGQQKAANLLGVTQGALSKAIRVGRNIYVSEQEDGSYVAEEVRPFPSQKSTS
ncbi:Cro [compost metagenome]